MSSNISPRNMALIESVVGPMIKDPGAAHRDGMCRIAEHTLDRILDAARAEGEATLKGSTVAHAMLAETGLPAFIAGHVDAITLRWSEDATRIMWSVEPEAAEVQAEPGHE